jgi:uncharacterized protein (DUF2384 family)
MTAHRRAPDAQASVREEAAEVFANPDAWLDAPNPHLGGRTPRELIGGPNEDLVRDLLESIKHVGVT